MYVLDCCLSLSEGIKIGAILAAAPETQTNAHALIVSANMRLRLGA